MKARASLTRRAGTARRGFCIAARMTAGSARPTKYRSACCCLVPGRLAVPSRALRAVLVSPVVVTRSAGSMRKPLTRRSGTAGHGFSSGGKCERRAVPALLGAEFSTDVFGFMGER
jgi:hypothetical protein